jgi:hypothetical protein
MRTIVLNLDQPYPYENNRLEELFMELGSDLEVVGLKEVEEEACGLMSVLDAIEQHDGSWALRKASRASKIGLLEDVLWEVRAVGDVLECDVVGVLCSHKSLVSLASSLYRTVGKRHYGDRYVIEGVVSLFGIEV